MNKASGVSRSAAATISPARLAGALALAFAAGAVVVYFFFPYLRWPAIPLAVLAFGVGGAAMWMEQRGRKPVLISPDAPDFRVRFRSTWIRAGGFLLTGIALILFGILIGSKLLDIMSQDLSVASVVTVALLLLLDVGLMLGAAWLVYLSARVV